jgi:hypothetical protein
MNPTNRLLSAFAGAALDAAREAFVWTLHGGAGLGAALATAGAVLALRLLRRAA